MLVDCNFPILPGLSCLDGTVADCQYCRGRAEQGPSVSTSSTEDPPTPSLCSRCGRALPLLVLASESPQRKRIFIEQLGLSRFFVCSSTFEDQPRVREILQKELAENSLDNRVCESKACLAKLGFILPSLLYEHEDKFVDFSDARRFALMTFALSKAHGKASDVANRLWGDSSPEPSICTLVSEGKACEGENCEASSPSGVRVVLAADTVVEVDGFLLEKPGDESEALDMLRRLSGKWHFVHTAYCIYTRKRYKAEAGLRKDVFFHPKDGEARGCAFARVCTTRVKFNDCEKRQFEDYIKTGEPFGKAGAYAIQGLGAQFVESIDGCFYNVVGLPALDVARTLDCLHRSGEF